MVPLLSLAGERSKSNKTHCFGKRSKTEANKFWPASLSGRIPVGRIANSRVQLPVKEWSDLPHGPYQKSFLGPPSGTLKLTPKAEEAVLPYTILDMVPPIIPTFFIRRLGQF